MKYLLFIISLSLPGFLWAQRGKPVLGQLLYFKSDHTSFPDSGRLNGYVYNNVSYPASVNYNDSTVVVVIPDKLNKKAPIDMVFWFHGWFNTIDSSMQVFKLVEQFLASNRNAILVIPETAKNAPDSYGGKLENPGMFRLLVSDILVKLQQNQKVKKRLSPGNILLAGHSGAYRLIAQILDRGGSPIREVILFDGLYGQLDKYRSWLLEDPHHFFTHWFTEKGGGTDILSDTLMHQLKGSKIPFAMLEEGSSSTYIPEGSRVLFIHSKRDHNDIIANPDNFRVLLERSKFLEKIH